MSNSSQTTLSIGILISAVNTSKAMEAGGQPNIGDRSREARRALSFWKL